MLKKIMTIFARDLKVNLRDFLTLYIFIFPILFAVGINAFTPGINDTTVNLALIENENTQMEEYFKQFAKVELFGDEDSVIKRVEGRDSIVGILPKDGSYYILSQGNEDASVIDTAKLVKTLYESGSSIEDTNATLTDLGRTGPPLKKALVNMAIMLTSVLGGMIISVNIVEEKVDNTVSAINVTTLSRTGFILGKSIIGLILPIYGAFALIYITGFKDVNVGMTIVSVLAITLISLAIGFIQGIKNEDVMSAAGSIKLMFIPLYGSILAINFLADKWQKFFYWIPFYWSYKSFDQILSYASVWKDIGIYSLIILAITSVVYILLVPGIRKGLE